MPKTCRDAIATSWGTDMPLFTAATALLWTFIELEQDEDGNPVVVRAAHGRPFIIVTGSFSTHGNSVFNQIKNWPQDKSAAACSPNGWMNCDLFYCFCDSWLPSFPEPGDAWIVMDMFTAHLTFPVQTLLEAKGFHK